ncbi:hypothetical protein C2G38_2260888 [Gigaspora rosea]|uniref:CCHC-type domain-containing protein n=1 Tax=Gigaspora rosea TaxID=44941 RepID=A0A397VWV4_9GLOM|nr:hypothetical protein C2G38_2260888 [Gigaspora rosea]
MQKALDIAIATSSYDELMGICHRFILDKQESQEESDTIKDDDDIEYNIKNPVISKRRGRSPGRAKTSAKIQDQRPKKKQRMQITEDYVTQEKDTRKTCQNCGNKGHIGQCANLSDNCNSYHSFTVYC